MLAYIVCKVWGHSWSELTAGLTRCIVAGVCGLCRCRYIKRPE